jgi:hypothetical protein
MSIPQDLRDSILFVGGLAGIVYQTLFAPAVSEALLVVFAAMVGLPVFLRRDESGKGGE